MMLFSRTVQKEKKRKRRYNCKLLLELKKYGPMWKVSVINIVIYFLLF